MFLQTDPIGYGDGPNWYNYAHGDPVNMVDPSGTVAGVDDIVVTATLTHLAPAVVAGVGTAIASIASFGHAIGHAIHCIFGCHHASHVVPSASPAEASTGDNITVFANRAIPDSQPFYNNGLKYVANPFYRASSVWVDRALLAAPIAIGAGAAAIAYLAAEGVAATAGEAATSEYTLTQTVTNNLATRPYINSPLTVQEIESTGLGVPDPGGIPGALRYSVPGSFRGSTGAYELVIHPEDRIIYHFLFRGGP